MQAVRTTQHARTMGIPASLALSAYVFQDLEPTETEAVLSRAIRDHAERLQRSFDIVWSEVRETGRSFPLQASKHTCLSSLAMAANCHSVVISALQNAPVGRGNASPRARSPAKAGPSSAKPAGHAPLRLSSISLRRRAASEAPQLAEAAPRPLAVTRSDVSSSTQPGSRVGAQLLERGISLTRRPSRDCFRIQPAAGLPSTCSGCEASPMSTGTPFTSPSDSTLASPSAAAAAARGASAWGSQQSVVAAPQGAAEALGASLGSAPPDCIPPKRARGATCWAVAGGSGNLDTLAAASKLPKIALPALSKLRPQSDTRGADVV